MNKIHLLEALHKFIAQKPGLETGNYIRGPQDASGIAAYRSDSRTITKDRRDAHALLRYVAMRNTITVQDIIEASKRVFSGRLTITPKGDGFDLDYCIGQYRSIEYRKAAAAVLAEAIWARLRDDAPQHHPFLEAKVVREAARRELGATLARRWFH
jgi:hypothetical protein